MLIYSDRYRGWGKQKPKQWGPLSAVRSAVFANAERMGIDSNHVHLILPFWSGAYDVAKGLIPQVSGTVYHEGVGYYLDGTTDFLKYGDGSLLDGLAEVTVFLRYKSDRVNVDQAIFGGIQDTNSDTGFSYRYDASGFKGGGTNIIKVGLGSLGTDSANVSLESVSNVQTLNWQAGVLLRKNVKLFIRLDGEPGETSHTQNNDINNTVALTEGLFIGAGRTNSSATGYFKGLFDYFYIFSTALLLDQIQALEETPYALLQPISTPYIFDLGASTGTTVTIYADSRARISNSFFKTADSLSGISNINSLFADTLSGVSNTRDISADTLTGVSNVESEVADYLAAISNSRSSVFDSKTRISNLRSILADSLAQISNARSILADTITIASNAESSTADSNISVSNEIARLIDTSVQIGTEGTVTVSFDTLAKISNVLSITGDSKAAVSNTLSISGDSKSAISTSQSVNSDTKQSISNTIITEADCKAIISELFSVSADSKLSISNTTITEADTRAIISGLTQVIAYCDTSLSISNIGSVLADLKVIVGPSGITLSTADIDAIANAVLAKLTGGGLSAEDIANSVWTYTRP